MNAQSAVSQDMEGQRGAQDDAAGAARKGPLTGRDVSASRSGADKDKGDKKAPGAFRTISEVAEDLDVQQHVLRFWETKFSQIRPLKRGGGRRYYRPEDLALLKRIHYLLYTEGYTIKGVQKLLKEKGRAGLLSDGVPEAQNNNQPDGAAMVAASAVSSGSGVSQDGLSSGQRAVLQAMLGELREIRRMVKSD